MIEKDIVLKTRQTEAPTRETTNAATAETTKKTGRKDTTIADITTNPKETKEMSNRRGMSGKMIRSVILGKFVKTGIPGIKEKGRKTMPPRSSRFAGRMRPGGEDR